MLKKLLLLTSISFCMFNVYAQEENDVKLVVEAGILPSSKDSENLGLFLNVEPKIRFTENTFFGLRIGVRLNALGFESNDQSQYNLDRVGDNGTLSFVPTFDYYWNVDRLRSYIGLGIGIHFIPDPIDVFPVLNNASGSIIEGSTQKKLGVLVRGGVELGKLRLGLEYNWVPQADITISDDQVIGIVRKSYVGLSIGHVFGGG